MIVHTQQVNLTHISRQYLGINKMKIDLTTGTWQNNPGCPINITLVSTSDELANIPDRGFLFLYNTLLLYSLSPYSQTERLTESQIYSLHVGWRNLFSSCAIVSVSCSGGKQVLVLHTPYVLRVPYSCGVVLVLFNLAGNSFWYVRTQCTIQLCGCVSFFVVTGKLIQYKFSC